MPRQKFTTPILLIVFNRPDYMLKQLAILRNLQPTTLYIAADGPRLSRDDDLKNCLAVRELGKKIDWPCRVKSLLRDKNLGCRNAVSSAIDWFFDNVEAGIILEDDCLADQSFFWYCAELLKKYHHTDEVMHISGTTFVPLTSNSSYDFSIHPISWGWATWRRAWKKYDVDMKSWPQNTTLLAKKFTNLESQLHWQRLFGAMYRQEINTWDYQWIYAVWKNNGLSCIPAHNLVANIGFDFRATHTKLPFMSLKPQPVQALVLPLVHPDTIETNPQLDQQLEAILEGSKLRKKMMTLLKPITRLFIP